MEERYQKAKNREITGYLTLLWNASGGANIRKSQEKWGEILRCIRRHESVGEGKKS
jgi:hypothetical protein